MKTNGGRKLEGKTTNETMEVTAQKCTLSTELYIPLKVVVDEKSKVNRFSWQCNEAKERIKKNLEIV